MRWRFYFFLIGTGLVILIWAVYLFCIQIFDPLHLKNYRDIRYKPSKEILIPNRGSIVDCRGNLFVNSVSYYQTDIDRKQVYLWAKANKISLEQAYHIIAAAFAANVPIEEETVYKRLSKSKNLTSIMISNKIKDSDLYNLSNYFAAKKLPGLTSHFSCMKRIYSKGLTAARVIGSVRENTNGENAAEYSNSIYKLSGQNGLELTYDKELQGQYGWKEVLYDANNHLVTYPGLHEKKPVNGLNLWLTLDTEIQDVVEEALAEGLQQYGAKNAAAVVMDVNTGRIYSMAGVSSEDYSEDPSYVRVKSNIPVSFLFEPGSTMKPFTALTALEYGLINPYETFPSGVRQAGNRTIRDTHNYGPLTARGVIAKSSNVGISIIGERVGKKRLYDELIKLGFGQKTGLNLFGESSGIFHKLEDWDGYTLHSVTFGYAISVTAIQLAAAYASVANGGNYVKPYIVDSFRDDTGKIVEQFEPKILRKVASKPAADTLKSYLQSVVEEGTASHIKLSYINIAGKTGTAQKKLEGQTGYAPGKYTGNFVGFFPVEKPEMVVVVVYDEPYEAVRFGGSCAAPTFQKIVENTLFLPSCAILPKSKIVQQSTVLTPNVINMSLSAAEDILRKSGLNYKVEIHDSSTVIVDQYPKPNVSLAKNYPIVLVTGKSISAEEYTVPTGIMPNLAGMTLRKAVQISASNKIKLKIKGVGIVRKQSIIAGTKIQPGSTCVVEATL
ncbi:MAG TPA: penicillin-binding transpeptidase domain-containing protein [Candidatus Cloacimonadota bacterium]|nr:penicillin-binding transpeptidase domain-containing protein [Candidatus Cloacimonadota bacterium]